MSKDLFILILIVVALLILWMVFDLVKGLLTKVAPRKPSSANDTTDYDFSELQMAVWLIEHPFTESITEKELLSYIKPAAEYMAKRYDCSDFRAIWLCKLRYALANSSEYSSLLTPKVDKAICDALTGFKYFLTSKGADSMCYYSENHQMVFAVSEYFAGNAYKDAVFAIDGKTGLEHMKIAKKRMNIWFEQRGKYGFSEFFSSNYLAVDIGALSILRTYCEDLALSEKTELTLNMILLDYALQMYNYGFTCPAGRNYARNNANFKASTSSLIIVDKIWNTGETDLDNIFSGFAYFFISLCNSGKYSVPKVIVDIGRDNAKGVIKSTSGLSLKEMKDNNLIGLEDHQLMLQLGMGALSNKEVLNNTLNALNKYKLFHNSFLAGFRFFNIRLLQYLGITKRISASVNPFSNGMALQRNEVYTYCCNDYKLSTNQLYFPGGYGAQQLPFVACLPDNINVFTTNPISNKEFHGYGVAPCAAQDMNCMLSIFNIPKRRIPLAPGCTRHYTSTYFPEEKFDEVITDGHYIFGRKSESFIALVGTTDFKYEKYENESVFEKMIFETYEFSEESSGPSVESYCLKDWTKGFDLRQAGNSQYVIYELGSATHESFESFILRIKTNPVSFKDNILSYATKSADLSKDVTYTLNYSGSFSVNGVEISTEHDRYDSRFVHALRSDDSITVKYNNSEYTFDLTKMDS